MLRVYHVRHMFKTFKQHSYLARTIVGCMLMLVLAVPLVMPLTASAQGYANSANVRQTTGVNSEQPPKEVNFEGCGIFPTPKFYGCIVSAAWTGMTMIGRFTTLVGLALDYSVQQMVVRMGQLVNGIPAVSLVWQTIRDLVNVMLVFLTIFMGIATILGISGYGYKQLLWKLVLSALLVNFSITLAKFVIDLGNIFAIETYKQILLTNQSAGGRADPNACVTNAGQPNENCLNYGLGPAFVKQMKLMTIYSVAGINSNGEVTIAETQLTGVLWISIFGSIFFIITAFVFGAAAFLILGRFAMLLFVIILSPIGLVAWITGVSGVGRKWWKTLIDQTFFLPVMFILWWVTLKLIIGMGNGPLGNANKLAEVFQTPSSVDLAADPTQYWSLMSTFIFFFIISAFLIMSLILSRKMGALGATAVINTGRSWSRAAGGMAFAYTAGAASSRAANLYQRRMARAQEQDADGNYVDNSRRAQFARRIAGGKIDRGVQKGLGAGANAGVLGTKSLNQRRDQNKKELLARRRELAEVGAREGATGHAATLASDRTTEQQKDAARRNIQALSTTALEDVAAKNPKLFNDRNFATALSAKQVAELQKSQNLDKDLLTQATGHRLAAHATSQGGTTTGPEGTPKAPDARAGRRATKALSESELRTLGTNLSDGIVGKNPKVKPLGPAEIQHAVETLPGAQITNLSDAALLDQTVMHNLTAAQLTALHNADRLTDAERQTIRTAVLEGMGTASAQQWFNNPSGPGASWV